MIARVTEERPGREFMFRFTESEIEGPLSLPLFPFLPLFASTDSEVLCLPTVSASHAHAAANMRVDLDAERVLSVHASACDA